MSLRHERVIERLRTDERVRYSACGNSMLPIIRSREEVLLAPVDPAQLAIGDVVLAKVRGKFFLHRVNALSGQRVQIANNRGHINGWTSRDRVYGIVVEVGGRPLPGTNAKVRRA